MQPYFYIFIFSFIDSFFNCVYLILCNLNLFIQLYSFETRPKLDWYGQNCTLSESFPVYGSLLFNIVFQFYLIEFPDGYIGAFGKISNPEISLSYQLHIVLKKLLKFKAHKRISTRMLNYFHCFRDEKIIIFKFSRINNPPSLDLLMLECLLTYRSLRSCLGLQLFNFFN